MSDFPADQQEPPAWLSDAPPIGDADLPLAGHSPANGKTNGHSKTTAKAEWPEPGKLPGGLLPVPPMVSDLIPPVFRAWLADVALRTQAPIDYAAVAAIIACGSLIGRSIGIRPKRQDDWTVVPNLWGGAVGRPGIMKSPMLAEALRPLQRLAADAFKQQERLDQDAHFDEMVAKAKQAKLEAEIKRVIAAGGDPSSLREELGAAAERPPMRRYIVNDSTVEQLGQLLNENPRGLLLFRDELIGFFKTLDKDGHENARAAYLEMWAGNGPPYVYDRVGRGTIKIESPCLAIVGGIQPSTLADYLGALARSGGGDDGLIQRFQLFVYPDVIGDWKNIDQWPDAPAKNKAYAIFKALDDLTPAEAAADSNDDEATPFLRFSDSAQPLFDEWRAKLEQRCRDENEHPAMAAHLSKFRSLMPSLALIFHLVGVVSRERAAGPVSAFAAYLAVQWCDYLEKHARRIFQALTERRAGAAQLLAAKIKARRLPDPFTVRQVCEHDWSGLTERESVVAAIEALEEYNWLRSEKAPSGKAGGRPKEVFRCNPGIWAPSPPPASPAPSKAAEV